VASTDLGSILSGQRVTFRVNSYPGSTFEGQVIEINPAMDEQTRSSKVRIRVVNSGERLKAGMFAQGEILTEAKASAIVIPAGAVYRDDRTAKSSYVFVLENGQACRRNVRTGQERDSTLEIVEGLRPGERLIAEQDIAIAEGVRVEARK
jgi:membrane fusion protein (multidrug efflux system)